ncbi:monocarboxylate transporter 9-like isoform X2 [Dermacentor variabilis]|uniref:monocarboxylate transporter 9-like isoform X2 n=1 Tax=Dermacentor variabilis TaxID=34621 RepID=UPI003F5B2285
MDKQPAKQREEENGQWLIAFSCAWMNFFHRGLIRGTAVVYVQLIQTFGITREEAALPLSLVSVIGGCSSLSVGLLTHYLNDRILVVLATLTSATGLVLCYTATSMLQINFYYSISQGLGTGLVFTLTAVILNNVFKKNRATASGINLSGPTLVALVFPLLFQYCARTYGLRGAFLISSGFTLNALPAAFLLSGRVREPPPPPEEPEIVNNPRYDCEVNITGSTFTLADISGSTSDIASKARNAARHGGNSVEKEKLLDAKDSGNNNEQLPTSKREGPERRRSDEVKLACNLSGAACLIPAKNLKEPLGTQRPHGVDPSRRAQERTFADRSCSLPLVKGTLPKVRISKFANTVSMFKVLLCSPYFLLVCLSQVSHVFNHGTFITIIIDYAKDNGIPPEEGIYILLANSAGDLVGRLGLGWISDKKLIERRKVMLLNYLLTGILMHLAPLCTTYASVTAIAVAMALAGGSTITLFSVLFFEYLGIRLMPLAYGLSNFAAGNANFFRPRLIGYYRDSHGKYDGLFQLLGSFQLFVSFLWLLSCVLEKFKHSRDAPKEQPDDAV